jgi:hypothetical protein
MMMVSMKMVGMASVAAVAMGVSSASAAVLVDDFSAHTVTGTYGSWGPGVQNATDWTLAAGDAMGGGWISGLAINGGAENTIELTLTRNPGDVNGAFNIVFVSADGGDLSGADAGWSVLPAPGTQTILLDLDNPDFFNKPNSSLLTWDKSDITEYHLQGNWGGDAVDLTFDNLVLTPEPASLALMGLGGLAMLRRKR